MAALRFLALLACIFALFQPGFASPTAATPATSATDSTVLTVGHLRAEQGHFDSGNIHFDCDTECVDIPVILINGAHRGPKVVLTAGVHGGEFVGSAGLLELADYLKANVENVKGRIVICPVVNPPAVYEGRVANSPRDNINMNRIFPGKADGSVTERLAAWLFDNLLTGADAYADLHSGGVDENLLDFIGYRLTEDDQLNEKTRAMVAAVGYERAIYSMSSEGGNSHTAATREKKIPSILIETGELGDRSPATVRTLVDGLYRLLRHLDVLEELPENVHLPDTKQRQWVWRDSVYSPATGFWYPTAVTGSMVTEGQIIGHIVDPAYGTEKKVEIVAQNTGTIIYGMIALPVVKGAELAAIAVLDQ